MKKKSTYKQSSISKQIDDHYQRSHDALATKRILWDEVESLFANKLKDQISGGTKSQVMDQQLGTMILEREARVMAKMPIGKFRPISSDDIASSQIMNLVMDKYIIPNANSQFPLLVKLRMMDRYSSIYGNFFAMCDWNVRKGGYIGPDLWLLAIRDVFPQVGAMSLDDSDRIVVRTWKPISFFENLGKDYKNVDKIIEALKDKTGGKDAKNSEDKSIREDTAYPTAKATKNGGYFEVLTMFERDRWVDYVPDAQLEFRDIKNPHDNGELPVVCKHSIPLIDDFMGMGDMERAKSMQYAKNSLWNLYLDAIKISIFPPTILNKDNIIPSTIKWGPGAKWLVRNSVGNSVQQLAINPRGIEAFQSTNSVLNASLLNIFGTTDTAVASETDPGFGKTPKALAMQSQRESSKDNVDKFYMEQTITDIMRKFANLWSKKAPKSTTVRMFKKEIEQLANTYPEIKDMYDETTGKLTINNKITGSTLFDYEIVSGSTYALDQDKQQSSLRELFSMLTQNLAMGQQGVTSPIMEAMKAEGKEVKIGELLVRILNGSGIPDWNKIIIDSGENQSENQVTPEDEQAMQGDQEQFLQMLQTMQGGGVNNIPTEGMSPQGGQMPPMPQQMPQGQPQMPLPVAPQQ